jgi:hypothetical protein
LEAWRLSPYTFAQCDPLREFVEEVWMCVRAVAICLSIILAGCASPPTQSTRSPAPAASIAVIAPATEQPIATVLTVSAPSPAEETTQQPFPFPVDVPPEVWESSGLAPDTIISLLLAQDYGSYGDIGVMHVDGTHVAQLTTYGYNADPILSPDRTRIAYRSVPLSITSLPDPGPRLYEGSYNIWVITVDGAQAWQLTRSEAKRSLPRWSPDSSKVVFSEGEGHDALLVEIEVDTQTRREVAQGALEPRYSPDGSAIGFITADGSLAWIEASGSTHMLVDAATLPANTIVHDFDWLPDGQRLVYALADVAEQIYDTGLGIKYSVWLTSLDATETTQLADDVHDVVVAPRGQWIAALSGSGYGDACGFDRRLAFLALVQNAAQVRGIDQFAGYPITIDQHPDITFYPASDAIWLTPDMALGAFDLTCSTERGTLAGHYLIDLARQRFIQITQTHPIADP